MFYEFSLMFYEFSLTFYELNFIVYLFNLSFYNVSRLILFYTYGVSLYSTTLCYFLLFNSTIVCCN